MLLSTCDFENDEIGKLETKWQDALFSSLM